MLRRLLRRPQLYLAGVVFLAAFSNVLLYNWQSSIGGLRSVSQEYPGRGSGHPVYLANIGAPLHGLLLTLSSTVDPTRLSSVFEPFVLSSVRLPSWPWSPWHGERPLADSGRALGALFFRWCTTTSTRP